MLNEFLLSLRLMQLCWRQCFMGCIVLLTGIIWHFWFYNVVMNGLEKGHKLAEVFHQINTIKQQIQAWMRPLTGQQPQKVNKNNSHLEKSQPYPLNFKKDKKIDKEEGRTSLDRRIINNSFELNSPRYIETQQPGTNHPQHNFDHHFFQTQLSRWKKTHPESKGEQEQRQPKKEEFKGIPKLKIATKMIAPGPTTSARKHTHARHATQYEVSHPFKISPPHAQSPSPQRYQTEHISQKNSIDRNKLLFPKISQFPKADTKRLTRMGSDFTGAKGQKRTMQRIRQLQSLLREREEDGRRKEETIMFISREMREIDRNFKLLENSLKTVLSEFEPFKEMTEKMELSQALKQLVLEMEQQRHREEALRQLNEVISRENQELRKQNKQFSSMLQGMAKGGNQQELLKVREEMKHRLAILASKLEVSVNENRLKDEFIVGWLRLQSQKREETFWVANTLGDYLKKCDYPRNRLLEKLNQQVQEIARLKTMLQKEG